MQTDQGFHNNDFQIELTKELVRSEQIRAMMLIIGTFISGTFFGIIGILGKLPKELYTKIDHFPILGILFLGFFVMVAYEIMIWNVLNKVSLSKFQFDLIAYITAFVEVSFPSFILIVFGQVLDPALALTTPALLLYLCLIILSALHLDFSLCFITGVIAGVEYFLVYLLLLNSYQGELADTLLTNIFQHTSKGFLFIFSGILTGFIAKEIKKRMINTFQSHAETQKIMNIFGQHVSQRVVKAILDEHGKEGKIRHVCVMFLDIRGFTSIAEKQAPSETVRYLNLLFEEMIQIINNYEGIINKFLGDGFMAVFGQPFSNNNPSEAAVKASLDIVNFVEKANQEKKIPKTRIGIGLHSGPVLTGHIGSSIRKEYTVISDVVNLASRIEGMNKEMKSQCLVSNDVWEEIEDKPSILNIFKEITIRGRKDQIDLYQIA